MATLFRITGVVQGVGFRPFIYRRAQTLGLNGWVRNDGSGVEIFLDGALETDSVRRALLSDPPPNSRIDQVTTKNVADEDLSGFFIVDSTGTGPKTAEIPIDLKLCDACLSELFDQDDRRYIYPYINCTDCGPRFSVVERLPYDRPNTTMHSWPLCEDCYREYIDVSNRRFHAEPIACPNCGPQFVLYEPNGQGFSETAQGTSALKDAAERLRNGQVVAVKGIGGYLLACDALNHSAVQALRVRKFRKDKPFALMARDLDALEEFAFCDETERLLLQSAAAPIVLMRARISPDYVAPGSQRLGLMLPYAPIHHLLFHFGAPKLLVMTSGNRSSEPMAYTEDVAFDTFVDIADAVLMGQRPIARRLDDSVVAVDERGRSVFFRRSRGYAPAKVTQMPVLDVPVLACGADLKSTVGLLVQGSLMVTGYLGDLSYLSVQKEHRRSVSDLIDLFEVEPTSLVVATDKHPDYRSHDLGVEYLKKYDARCLIEVQHHRAHIASVLAEHGVFDLKVLGVALDGTGYGDDGAIWGGEFFYGSLNDELERVAHLEYSTLVGGDAAAKYPLQCLSGHVNEDTWRYFVDSYGISDLVKLVEIAKNSSNLLTTSTGRLFDAAAAICGYFQPITYEGQAAIWLESLAVSAYETGYLPRRGYLLRYERGEIKYREYLEKLCYEVSKGLSSAQAALDFHLSFAWALVDAINELMTAYKAQALCFSGGVFQNLLLRRFVEERLSFVPLYNTKLSCNDENIAAGQAAVAVFKYGR